MATFGFGIMVRDYSVSEMFFAVVGLAVAAIPEGLPAIITITLVIGAQRMARRHAIIRRLPAVETFGSVTMICSDKTGTLTRNEMTVQTLVMADALLEISGVGYAPSGGFFAAGVEKAPEDYSDLPELCRAALLCNEASVREVEGRWTMEGDPTNGALVTLGMKAGLDPVREGDWMRLTQGDAAEIKYRHRLSPVRQVQWTVWGNFRENPCYIVQR